MKRLYYNYQDFGDDGGPIKPCLGLFPEEAMITCFSGRGSMGIDAFY